MPFTVRAPSVKPGEGTFQVQKATRKDAVKTTVGLICQGMDGVTIVDEADRVYQLSEFVQFLTVGKA